MGKQQETLRYDVYGQTAVITFARPDVRHALDILMREEIAALLPRIRADRNLRALIITGDGGAFCAGGDLKALCEEERPVELNRERIAMLHTWFTELSNLELPVIAAVDGPAYGAGLNLALAADFILASDRARFCAVFGRIGLVPDLGGFFLLPRIVGLARAKELIMTARSVGAEEARDLGMVLEIHAPEALMDAAMTLARRFDHGSRLATGMSKAILNQSLHSDQRALADMEAMAQTLCLASDYHKTAVQRFLDKKPLEFDWDRMTKENGKA
ncbi:enoyl-CoA hydratase/isomerase family protein [Sulfitobacter dubius]|uniref:Short-chain-enoyl-CoA hydratase n=1 Tax=Sulfitobacter dubius TaxID=218673 RepID=A0ABY3ZRE0_9RHOB|nr:enoyl-CoA hydratase/isomerase family protein [Sulfitobacter dubius]UOA17209.1 Short-chain-enoyl-CoA hydratase [Sulfitobacter dubius]